MAEHGETPLRTDTFDGFMRMTKIGTIVTIVLTVIVVALIAS